MNVLSAAGVFLVTASLAAMTATAAEPLATPDPATIEWPSGFPPSDAEVALGKMLFFDTRLSGNGSQSCASCHNPNLGFSDGVSLGRGAEGAGMGRNTPHLYNLAWGVSYFWDGRARSLEQQALMPIESNDEMNLPIPELVERLNGIDGYRKLFKDAYGADRITKDHVASALASFERTLISRDSPFDRYLAGDAQAMSVSAIKGLELFRGKADCVACHDGPNFTDESFHNIGVRGKDKGREAVVEDKSLRGAFKTPGLRNVALTAPYMHDGSEKTLEDVVRFYNRGGDSRRHRSELVKPLGLSEEEVLDLVAFLGALTDPLIISRPELPQ